MWDSDRYHDWREDYDEKVEVLAPFWTMDYNADMTGSGDFMLTESFAEWCRNNLAHPWDVCSGTLYCSREDATFVRLYMGGG